MIVNNRPILLRNSAMVFTTEKGAVEIQIFTLNNRGLRAQISRSCALKRRFNSQYAVSLEGSNFPTQSVRSSHSVATKS